MSADAPAVPGARRAADPRRPTTVDTAGQDTASPAASSDDPTDIEARRLAKSLRQRLTAVGRQPPPDWCVHEEPSQAADLVARTGE